MKTTNKNCREKVKRLEPFTASNLSGIRENAYYIVYSYKWYPLYAFSLATGWWYENTDKYSNSTSRQKSQSNRESETIAVTHHELKDLIGAR